MKYSCKHCHEHLEFRQLEGHLAQHNEKLAEPVTEEDIFEEVKHVCPDCKHETMVARLGRFICQNCSHEHIQYANVEDDL